MNRLIIIWLFGLWCPLALISQEEGWPSYRANPALTGKSDVRISAFPALLWSFQTDDIIKSSPVMGAGNIFIGTNGGSLYCLSSEGKEVWRFSAETSIEAPPLFLDQTIFVGSLEGIMFALDANTGTEKWRYITEGQISGAANWTYAADKKSKQLIFGSYDYYLHCVDALTGKPL
ncbi:PQQ-like beta-propeller repeat protein, partial [bacterium]|nr:PQQ-like beta-propeller repeat protein [bacterium]